jgi:hypothetical protein
VWLLETTARSGGLREAIEGAISTGHIGGGGTFERLRQYLDLLDGPLTGPVAPTAVAWWGFVVLAGAACVAVVGCRGPQRRAASLAAICAAASSLVAVGAVGGIATRFLLPALAFASIPIALGLVRMWSGSTLGRIGGVAFALLLLSWNVATLSSVGRLIAERRGAVAEVARVVAGRAQAPCRVLSDEMFPQIAYVAGCDGAPLRPLGAAAPPIWDPATQTIVVSGTPIHAACLEPSEAIGGVGIAVAEPGCPDVIP